MSDSHSHAAHAHHPEPSFLRKYIFSEDHKIIGIQFLFSSIIFLFIGGFLAMLVRIQLGWPHSELPVLRKLFYPRTAGYRLPPTAYNLYFSIRPAVRSVFVLIPLLHG